MGWSSEGRGDSWGWGDQRGGGDGQQVGMVVS